MTSTTEIKSNILSKIDAASDILVLTSKPIDPDSFGTALTVRYWLQTMGKNAEVASGFEFNGLLPEMKNIDTITKIDVATFDFGRFDLVFIVDAGSWSQIFANYDKDVVAKLGAEKFVGVDHHSPGEIQATLPDTFLIDTSCSCTAEVLYSYFLKPAGTQITSEVADYMYDALISDTGGFSWLLGPHTFEFADVLYNAGADHYRLRDINIPNKELLFMAWAIEHTDIDLESKASFLIITPERLAELKEKFGPGSESIRNTYKFSVMGKIEGVDYSFILVDKKATEGYVEINWRCRNYGSKVDTVKMTAELGCTGGGHRNAGGGKYFGDVVELRNKISNYIKANL